MHGCDLDHALKIANCHELCIVRTICFCMHLRPSADTGQPQRWWTSQHQTCPADSGSTHERRRGLRLPAPLLLACPKAISTCVLTWPPEKLQQWTAGSLPPKHPRTKYPCAGCVVGRSIRPTFGSLAVNKCEHFVCRKSMNTNTREAGCATMR